MFARLGFISVLAVCGVLSVARSVPAQPGGHLQVTLSGQVVGEDGQSVAGASIQPIGWKQNGAAIKADGEGRFSFAAETGGGGWIYSGLVALAADGRLGFLSVELAKPEPVRVVVKPARELKVLVQDRDGNPAAGADVQFHAAMRLLVTGETDAHGAITCRVPADARNWAVLARKSQLGFDYRTSERGRGSTDEPYPLPGEIKLQLDGARTVRVTTVDRSGKPVAGVKVGVWYLQKPGYDADINLSGTFATWPVTNSEGVVVLDWLPEKFVRNLPIMPSSEDYYPRENATSILADKPASDVKIELLPMEGLSGRVTRADGRPAAGMTVTVCGQGTSHNAFLGSAKTDNDGRYELSVYSEQAYLVRAGDEALASPCRGDIVVRAGQPASGVDLVVGPATRIEGRVTVGNDKRPVGKSYISAVIDRGEITKDLPRQPNDRIYYGLRMYFNVQTDAEGKFQLLLGPGDYQLSDPARTQPAKLTITAENPPPRIVQDFQMPRTETGPFAGCVVDSEGRPVAGALVDGHYASSQARRSFRELKTDEQGRFKVERSLDSLVLRARTADGKLAGVIQSEAEQTDITIEIRPVTTAAGRLRDLEGKAIAQRELRYGICVYLGESGRSAFHDAFGGVATTDEGGNFKLAGLVPGQAYSLSIRIDEHSSHGVTEVTVPDAKPLALGELTADPNPTKPYVPPTPAERTATAFAAKRDMPIAERMENLLAEAKREYVRPMLLFGQASDPACVELFRLFGHQEADGDKAAKPDYRSPAELRWEFELAALDVSRPELRDLAAKLKIDLAAGKPVLAMLNRDGSLAETLPLEPQDKKLDPRPIGSWLARHKLPTRDAQKMLDDALAQAKAEDKKVFFILSASWCGPCRMLARFLAPHKPELEKHFVFVKLDISRDEHAEALQERFKESAQGGVPWFCILDREANVLTTSNLPKVNPQYGTSNMGFPTLPAEVEHFAQMLRTTAPKLPEEKLAEYKAELLKKK